jgi:hypothetical protein
MPKALWGLLLVVALAAIGGIVYASVHAGSANPGDAQGFICPLTGEELPCPACCPLNTSEEGDGFICPLTGEKLPCEKCCPLNNP